MLFKGNGVNGATALRALQQQSSGNTGSKNGEDGRSVRTNGSSKAGSNASTASEKAAIKRGPPTPDRLLPAAEEEAEAIAMLKCPFYPSTGEDDCTIKRRLSFCSNVWRCLSIR